MKTVLFYEDLNWFGRLLYGLKLKKYLTHKLSYEQLINNQLWLEKNPRKDRSFRNAICEE